MLMMLLLVLVLVQVLAAEAVAVAAAGATTAVVHREQKGKAVNTGVCMVASCDASTTSFLPPFPLPSPSLPHSLTSLHLPHLP